MKDFIWPILIYLLRTFSEKPHPIVKPMQLRFDSAGSGVFDASRASGTREHKGLDVLTHKGQEVFAPYAMTIERISYPYRNDTRYKGIEGIEKSGRKWRIWYFDPIVKPGQEVRKGQLIGHSANVAERYPGQGMKPHLHVELTDKGVLIDPNHLLAVYK